MKKIECKLLGLIIVIMAFQSCVKEKSFSQESDISVQVDYGVHLCDVEAILSLRYGAETKSRVYDVKPYVYNGDTVMYIVNYTGGEGWEIFSGDKRSVAILACSDSGSFVPLTCEDGGSEWISMVANEIYAKKHSKYANRDTMVSDFWKNRDFSDLKENIQTKGDSEDNIHENDWLQLVYTTYTYETIEIVEPLIQTKWGQGYPWNEGIPYKSENNRAAAGCITVALAQLSYYTHYTLGKPLYAPSFSYCVANQKSISLSDFHFAGFDANVWDDMPKSLNEFYQSEYSSEAVVSLLSYIYSKKEHLETSSSSDQDVRNYLDTVSVGYYTTPRINQANIEQQLEGELPVLVIADNLRSQNNDDKAHCWLIDGYKVMAPMYIYYNQWMPRGTYPPVEPVEPDWDHLENYVISDPVMGTPTLYYHMNWGYAGMNDGFYSGTLWLVDSQTLLDGGSALYFYGFR